MLAKALGKSVEDITPSLEKDGVQLEGAELFKTGSELIVQHLSAVKKEQLERTGLKV